MLVLLFLSISIAPEALQVKRVLAKYLHIVVLWHDMAIELQPPTPTPEFSPPRLALVPAPENHLLGVAAEQTANVLTLARAAGGVALNHYIEATPDYQSWKTAGAFTVLAATDGEGFLARWGRRRQGKEESKRRPWNAYGDHLADKVLVDGVMQAIAHREEANGHRSYAMVVSAASKTTITRDVVTTADRIVADTQNIDTRAQNEGKMKALEQYAVTAVALSPLAKKALVRSALGVAFLHTAKQSVKSGLSLHENLAQKRHEKGSGLELLRFVPRGRFF